MKKIRTGKKGRKSKRPLPAHQRGAPWPPRSSGVVPSVAIVPTTIVEPITREPSPPHVAVAPTDLTNRHGSQTLVASAGMIATQSEAQDDTHKHASRSPEIQQVANSEFAVQSVEFARPVEHGPFGISMDGLLQQQGQDHSPDHSSSLPLDESSLPLEPLAFEGIVHHDQPHEVSYKSPAAKKPERPEHMRPELQHTPDQQLPLSQRNEPALCEQVLSLPQAFGSSVQKATHQHKQTAAVGEGRMARSAPYRIEKPSKKKRPVSGPQVFTGLAVPRVRGPAVHGGFESTLESLRVAYAAEQHQQKDALAMQTKNYDEAKRLYQDQINQYIITVAEWKERYHGLSGNVTQLREKAKTNQKYVTGLQKDYEKLQKLAANAQNECRNILQHKIAEVENEKESLRRELETTLDTVAKGQKASKDTIEELYVRLIISDSKRKDLAENLSGQVAMFEEEKKKRNALEKELLSSVQGVERQVGNCSKQLFEKIENLKTSVESAAREDEEVSSAHQCLVILRELQGTPSITTKDLRKAEGMLRFVHEG